MEKLKMHSLDKLNDNILKIGMLFPNCLTERINSNGEVERAIDFDVLRQELSKEIVEGNEERYQFTWPDKKNAMRLANAPINKTLRPCREESVDFDATQNLYIEGDNLEVLKLLQETYLGKIKMIYIDPPYNTGNDFVYEDDFSQSVEEYFANSGQQDEDGNRLVQNTESNGRFHTDWLNMMYPRLKLAKDLLSDDGVIFISIDDNEVENLKKICNEVLGEGNFVAILNWRRSGGRQDSKYYAVIHEYIVCYAKSINYFQAGEEIKNNDVYSKYDEECKRFYKTQLLRKWGSNSLREDRPNLYYPIYDPDGNELYPTIYKESEDGVQKIEGCWRWGKNTFLKALEENCIEFQKNKYGEWVAYEKIFAPKEGEENTKKYNTWIDDIGSGTITIKNLFPSTVFDYSKAPDLVSRFLKMANINDGDIILDFFSGSATTAHAVMQLNVEDGGKRKFIMVQLPEECDAKSEAFKAGYKNICEIGKERIRRAGKKIKEDNPLTTQDLDIGFRVLKCDSSNMKDVYYTPSEYNSGLFDELEDNIKDDRTPEDLLFQVMLDLGVLLSSKIEAVEIGGKHIFNVESGYLMACFDNDLTDEVIKEVAKLQPYYFVMRDSSMASDSVAANFEQIFNTYSPNTVRRVL